MNSSSTDQRLAGLTVVEDGSSLAVQLAGKLLSDLGCHVVRRQRDHLRLPVAESTIEWLSQGKTKIGRIDGLAQTLTRSQGPTILLTEDAHTHSSVTGFASVVRVLPEDDEGFIDVDSSLSSKTGVMWSSKEGFAVSPRMTKLAIPSVFSALVASIAVVASSIRFLRDRQESDVLVSLERATLLGIGALGIVVDGKLGAGGGSRDRWGKGLYKCKDGRWVQLCTERPKFIDWLGDATGRLDDWRARGFIDRDSLAKSPALLDAWRRELHNLFATRNAEEWEWIDPRIPLTVVNIDSDVKQSRLVRDDFIGKETSFKPPAPLLQFVSRSEALAPTPSRESVNGEGGGEAVERGPSLPLDGIRVSDCGSVLAAPVAGRVLADLGAAVTKFHLPGTDMSDLRYWVDVNRGKSAKAIDLRQRLREHDLYSVLTADVLIHNFTSDAQKTFGVDSRRFFEHRPDGIYGEISAYGRVAEGAQRRGYEVNAQASYGLMDVEAGGKPAGQPLMVNDYATGLALALGVLAGVYGRHVDRRGTAVCGSLARTAALWRAMALGRLSEDGLTLERFDGMISYLAVDQKGWACYERNQAPAFAAERKATDETLTTGQPSLGVKARVLRMDDAIRAAVAQNDGRTFSYEDEHGSRISLSGAPWTSAPSISWPATFP